MSKGLQTSRIIAKHQWINFLLPAVSLVIVAAVGLLIHLDQRGGLPEISKLQYNDAGWYRTIVEKGYEYQNGAANDTAFFPLFPYVWRWSGMGLLGISIINGCLFILSSGFLLSYLGGNWRTKMFALAVSILVFFMSPFSESLFFAFGVVMLLGLEREKRLMTCIGIIGCSLTRSVASFFAPAFLLIGLIRWYRTRSIRSALPYGLYTALSVATMFAVFGIQWYQTGEFFAFIKTQKAWSTEWQLPKIPFNTWGSEDNWLYDQLALFICLLATVWSVIYVIRTIISRSSKEINPAALMSIFYCCGLGLLMLFTKGGRFNSVNRYVFCTPFLFVIIHEAATARTKWFHHLIVLALGLAFFIYCWEMNQTATRMLNAAGLILFTIAVPLLLRIRTKWAAAFTWILIAGLLYVQAQLWCRYMVGEWIA